MYGVFFVSVGVDSVYLVFTLRQTLHPFIYCFNIPLIYRFIEEFRISTEKKQKTAKIKKQVKPRDMIATSWLKLTREEEVLMATKTNYVHVFACVLQTQT